MRHVANESAFETRGDLISSGNFQAKLKLDSFAEFEAHQKIGAALEMFMVSAGTDTGELFIASVIGIGTRLMRRAAKRGAIVTQGFPGTGGQRAFGSWGVFSLRKSGRASIRLLSGDRGSQVARGHQTCWHLLENLRPLFGLTPCPRSTGHLILATRPVVGYFWNCSASWPGMTRSGLPPASWIMRS